MPQRNVSITDDQDLWLEEHMIHLPKLVRRAINTEMKKYERTTNK